MLSLSPQIIEIFTSTVIIIAIITTVIILTINKAKNDQTKQIGWKKWIWLIIACSCSVGFIIAGILIYFAISRKYNIKISPKIIIFIVIGCITLGLIIGGIYQAITYNPNISNDKPSENRMTQLNQTLTSIFGPKWSLIFVIFAIFLIIIFVLLYFGTRQGIQLTISDNSFEYLHRYFIGIAIFITAVVVFLLFLAWRKYKEEQQKQQDQNGDFNDSTKTQQLLELIGLGLVMIVVASILIALIMRSIKSNK